MSRYVVMSSASRLATTLDIEMLLSNGTSIAAPSVSTAMPERPGVDVALEICGRFLIRYIRPHQLGTLLGGTDNSQWVTPTPYPPEDAVRWLALPDPRDPPRHALLLDAARIRAICGPRYVRLGGGLEYLLPQGFPRDAIVDPAWEIEVS